MKAEILSIGDELLIGDTVNTNAAFIAQNLTDLGIDVSWISTVGDNKNNLVAAIRIAEERAGVIIATGGLGPTHDDITKKVFAEYFHSELVLNEEILASIRERFRKRKIPMADSNREQAFVPSNAEIIPNAVGTASGLLFERSGEYFFVLPGVPAEMKYMMNSFVIPFLKARQTIYYRKRIIHTAGLPESTLFEKLGNVDELERFAKIAFLPTNGGVDIRISKTGEGLDNCENSIATVEKVFDQKFSQYIWGKDNDTLEDKISAVLIQQDKSLSLIEVGTKGTVLARLFNSEATSKVLKQAVAFGNLNLLISKFNISPEMLEEHGFLNETEARKIIHELSKETGSNFGLLVVHDEDRENTTNICFGDQKNLVSRHFVFNLAPSINLQRIATFTLKIMFEHLTGQKIS